MGFHRFVTPTYFKIPVGDDLINVVSGGTGAGGSAFANAKKVGGPNTGTYFNAYGEEGVSANFNRGLRALAENCDFLDNIVHTDIATATFDTGGPAPGGGTAFHDLAGTPLTIFMGVPGNENNAVGLSSVMRVLDSRGNDIIDPATGRIVRVWYTDQAALDDPLPDMWVPAATVRVYFTPAIPEGVSYHLHYGIRSELATSISNESLLGSPIKYSKDSTRRWMWNDNGYDYFGLRPTAGPVAQKMFFPLQSGSLLVRKAGRNVTVNPLRVVQGSAALASPRDCVTGYLDTATDVAMSAVAGAGRYGFDLLYAKLTHVNPLDREQGTVVTLHWATPAYALLGAAATFGSLPADSATEWYIPLSYVRNYDGQVTTTSNDIIECPQSSAGLDYQRKAIGHLTGHSAARAYSSNNNDPTTLINGGTSAYLAWSAGGENEVLDDQTPAIVGRRSLEVVDLEIMLPASDNGVGTGADSADTVIDDTRDWRNANFSADWWINDNSITTLNFAEDDFRPNCIFPALNSAYHKSVGQSFQSIDMVIPAFKGGSSMLWAAVAGNIAEHAALGPLNGVTVIGAGDGYGLWVNPADGSLNFWSYRAGGVVGPAVYIQLRAFFPNHSPVL